MRNKKIILISSLILMAVLLIAAGPVWAGGNEDPPTTGTIVGPELWGVMVYHCGENGLTFRVKRIVDCNVETQAYSDFGYALGCPGSETSLMYRKLGVTIFDINPDPSVMTPIITKVKNFKKEPGDDLYSADVQIKFLVP